MSSAQKTDQIRFRCSRLSDLMTGANGITAKQLEELARLQQKNADGKITEKQLVELGKLTEKKITPVSIAETTKKYIKEIWLRDKFGFKKDVLTDAMLKGLLCEQDSIGLVQQVLGGEFRIKNTKRFYNEWLEGTPDVILNREDVIEDVKTCEDLQTFFNAELIPEYEWQGHGYMNLVGKRKYRLIYALIPTPYELIVEQKKRWWFKYGCDDNNPHYIEVSNQIDTNNDAILTIPEDKRLKIFEFDYSPEKIELAKSKAIVGNEYYNSLSL